MLADRISPRKKPFDEWLDGLKPDHRETVDGWLRNPRVSATALASAIRDDDADDDFTGYKANHGTILDWRRRNGVA